MLTLSSAGAGFRSKCLPEAKARQFAACLAANAQYTAVQVEESRRAQGEARFFVTYQPAEGTRYGALVDRQQNQRLRTSLAEGDGYTFCLDQDAGRAFFHCFNPKSGEVYEVTEHGCTCADHTYRCRPAGLRCKHQLALLNGLGQAASF